MVITPAHKIFMRIIKAIMFFPCWYKIRESFFGKRDNVGKKFYILLEIINL